MSLSKQAKRDEELFSQAREWWASVEESRARQVSTSPGLGFWHSDLPEVRVTERQWPHHPRIFARNALDQPNWPWNEVKRA